MKLTPFHWLVFIAACALVAVSVVLDVGRLGFFLGAAASIVIVSSPMVGRTLSKTTLLTLLYLNLVMVTVNTFGADIVRIPPVFRDSGVLQFDKVIVRAVSVFGNTLLIRRRTGISDNVHITSLLLVFLIAYATASRSKGVSRFATLMLLIGNNIQYILIWGVWLYARKESNRAKLPSMAAIFIVGFFAVDYIAMSGAYSLLIGTIDLGVFYSILGFYLAMVPPGQLLFGMPSGVLDYYFSNFSYIVPIDDIGLIGVPMLYGLFGVLLIAGWIHVMWRYARPEERILLSVLLLSLIHYFNLPSFLGAISFALLIKTMRLEFAPRRLATASTAPLNQATIAAAT